MKPTRFDEIETAIKKETHKNLYNSSYNAIMKEYDKDLDYKAIQRSQDFQVKTDKKVVGITPQDIRLQLMRGNGNLIGSKNHTEMITTTYQAKFKGLPSRYSNKPIGWDLTTSCSTGVLIPDPLVMSVHKNKK